jgi:hypothetical protein
VSDVELPIRVERRAESVRVRTLSVHPVARGTDGRVRFAGSRSRGFRTSAASGSSSSIPTGRKTRRRSRRGRASPDASARLEHTVALLDGVPVLVVLTTTADKLSLFGEKKLRIFPLAPDRTRSGSPRSSRTRPDQPVAGDVAGDPRPRQGRSRGSRPRLLEGLKDTIAALEVRRRNADGTFARREDAHVRRYGRRPRLDVLRARSRRRREARPGAARGGDAPRLPGLATGRSDRPRRSARHRAAGSRFRRDWGRSWTRRCRSDRRGCPSIATSRIPASRASPTSTATVGSRRSSPGAPGRPDASRSSDSVSGARPCGFTPARDALTAPPCLAILPRFRRSTR